MSNEITPENHKKFLEMQKNIAYAIAESLFNQKKKETAETRTSNNETKSNTLRRTDNPLPPPRI